MRQPLSSTLLVCLVLAFLITIPSPTSARYVDSKCGIDECVECGETNNNLCDKCEDHFYKSGGGASCKACENGCKSCSEVTGTTTKCTKCFALYKLNDDDTCSFSVLNLTFFLIIPTLIAIMTFFYPIVCYYMIKLIYFLLFKEKKKVAKEVNEDNKIEVNDFDDNQENFDGGQAVNNPMFGVMKMNEAPQGGDNKL